MRRLLTSLFVLCFTTLASADPLPPAIQPIPLKNHIGGAVVGTSVGFGLGHAIQGRFRERGWIYLAVEAAAVVLLTAVAIDCINDFDDVDASPGLCTDPVLGTGLIVLGTARTLETVDVWLGPVVHNARLKTGPRLHTRPVLGRRGTVEGLIGGVALPF
jgi:hypothetical protein